MIGHTSNSPMLLPTPFPLLHPRPSLVRLSRHSIVPLHPLSLAVSGPHRVLPSLCSQPRHGLPLRAIEQVHTQTGVGVESGECSPRPWPEWVEMVEHVTAGGYTGRQMPPPRGEDDDSLSISVELPEGFEKAAGACLLFARERPDLLRLLPKRDIEVVVENISPFLFKNALNSVKRMKAFIGGDGSDVLASEQASTVDVMRYLLSYVGGSDGAAGGDDTKFGELVETSVKSLLHELVNIDGAVREPNSTDSAAGHTLFRYEQSQKPPGQKIKMKRGDWICPKCNFMNFTKNIKCLECSESRPKRQLTGAEWECPQCDFFNYGRNMACLRCDCKRPGEISALERRLGNAQYMHSSVNEGLVEGSDSLRGIESDKMSESVISRKLDKILGCSSATSRTKDTGTQPGIGEAGIRARSRFTSPERGDSGYVPFVPLPADMFSKKPTEEQQLSAEEDVNSIKTNQLTDNLSRGSGSVQSIESSYSEDFDSMTMSKTDKESSDPSEIVSWKAAQLPDDNNLASAIPDDDFPEIMPMRKGENRFVVGKKKDRSLTSPQYKRRIAMEQANNSNFVPFVPFPPGYFAKKDEQPKDGSSTNKVAAETYASALSGNDQSGPQRCEENNPAETMWRSAGNIGQVESSRTGGSGEDPTLLQSTANSQNKNAGSFNRGYSREGTVSRSVPGSLNPQVKNPEDKGENGNSGFSRKSLEGSAVTEPDPLDMSEEAKAQRWFRRVAQINDISELSKIPDEDFPEIMPMRKGVNRFVVSKRKTPLERRLTSPHYRRNLPIVSSEPEDSN